VDKEWRRTLIFKWALLGKSATNASYRRSDIDRVAVHREYLKVGVKWEYGGSMVGVSWEYPGRKVAGSSLEFRVSGF
jgi:hypothetical protein